MADEVDVVETKEPWYKNILSWLTKPEVLNAGTAVFVAVLGLISAIATNTAVKALKKRK